MLPAEARSPAATAPACASAGRAGPTGHHHPILRPGQVAIGAKAPALSRAERGGVGCYGTRQPSSSCTVIAVPMINTGSYCHWKQTDAITVYSGNAAVMSVMISD